MENQKLERYVGDYDNFRRMYEVKKAQQEAAYRAQQQEIAELQDFVARNKARVATRNMAMSRQDVYKRQATQDVEKVFWPRNFFSQSQRSFST